MGQKQIENDKKSHFLVLRDLPRTVVDRRRREREQNLLISFKQKGIYAIA